MKINEMKCMIAILCQKNCISYSFIWKLMKYTGISKVGPLIFLGVKKHLKSSPNSNQRWLKSWTWIMLFSCKFKTMKFVQRNFFIFGVNSYLFNVLFLLWFFFVIIDKHVKKKISAQHFNCRTHNWELNKK